MSARVKSSSKDPSSSIGSKEKSLIFFLKILLFSAMEGMKINILSSANFTVYLTLLVRTISRQLASAVKQKWLLLNDILTLPELEVLKCHVQ